MTIRQAMARSVNSITAQMMQALGPRKCGRVCSPVSALKANLILYGLYVSALAMCLYMKWLVLTARL